MSSIFIVCLFLLPLVSGVYIPNPENPDHPVNQNRAGATFGYTAADGPLTWPTTFTTCAGKEQSPINIVPTFATTSTLSDFTTTDYDKGISGTLENTGSSLKFSINAGQTAPTITGGRLGTDTFEFAQFHWHWGSTSTQGSEHTIDSKQYPAELHLVHVNTKYGGLSTAVTKPDGLAVLGFFYEVSSGDNSNLATFISSVASLINKRRRSLEVENYVLSYNRTNSYADDIAKNIIANIDNHINTESEVLKSNRTVDNLNQNTDPTNRQARANLNVAISSINLNQLLPNGALPTNYYYYKGSLTTPTCDESVLWTVFDTTASISESQLTTLRTLTKGGITLNDNYRPPQPLNGRTVYYRSQANALALVASGVVAASLTALVIASAAAILGVGADLSLPSIQLPTSLNNRNTQILEDEEFIIQNLSDELSIDSVRK